MMNNIKTMNTDELYQDEFTRRPNGLLYTIRELFNKHKLKTWEYQEFTKMVRSFCKEYDLYFDENKEMLYKYTKQINTEELTNNTISTDVFIRPFKSSFKGKLLKEGIEIDKFNCVEEFTDVRFKIITNKLTDTYSFIFDFDEEKKEYKMNELGEWNFIFPEYNNLTLNMNIGIRDFQIDGTSKYYECY